MDTRAVILAVATEVKARFASESSGHDWWHTHRVWRMAERIGRNHPADMLVVELAALLHDIADWKFQGGDETIGPQTARAILERHNLAGEIVAAVTCIVAEISFKGAGAADVPSTIEGRIVQDADRLDAIGAIGIARAFAYGGHAGQAMHDPEAAPAIHRTKQEYFSNKTTTINHFHEKLLLLTARMNTPEAKQIAEARHGFMRDYLDRFGREWDGLA
jgi:uncharacterized protein